MTVNQSDLDSFHHFATDLLAQAGRELSLDEIVNKWRAGREHAETIESVCRGIADAEAGRMHDLADVDAKIRTELGFAPRGRFLNPASRGTAVGAG
jgi:hypothetical protein